MMMIEAVKLYEFMTDGPFKPSVEDCSLLLKSLSAGPSPDLDLVYRVSRKYESTGKPLSKAVYDGIHRYLTSVARFDKAGDTMKAMRDAAGCEPDNVTYSQLVFGLCKAKRLEEACGVLDQMEADGCLPDVRTWSVLIQGYYLATPQCVHQCYYNMTNVHANNLLDTHDLNTRLRAGNSLVNVYFRHKFKLNLLLFRHEFAVDSLIVRHEFTKTHLWLGMSLQKLSFY
ncbi:hypothetical protein IGI04_023022 [Brassica rapa subsp. trilocularis]|uniref:Pentacotripeptide-repeat region of PRORP domain-containing protein n=1 Tax=Brassica rapa subsp. trilocularis TaxID=1813537 RepID=A0ABQ7M620_BRACM|nr:hypothetical protein IGI04_023022 [Brassica rapa subsp. trilocularis]